MEDYWSMKVKDKKHESEGPLMMASSGDDSRVSVEHNKIYFYSGVTRQDNLQLNKLIHTTGHKLANIQKIYNMPVPPKLRLHINSYGGSVFAGFGSVDYIRTCQVPVVSVIDGCAAFGWILGWPTKRCYGGHELCFQAVFGIRIKKVPCWLLAWENWGFPRTTIA